MPSITIHGRFVLIPEDGTGELCMICGDSCWLKQYRPGLSFSEESNIAIDNVVCQSCADALTEEKD
jgi:hypothetical protein